MSHIVQFFGERKCELLVQMMGIKFTADLMPMRTIREINTAAYYKHAI